MWVFIQKLIGNGIWLWTFYNNNLCLDCWKNSLGWHTYFVSISYTDSDSDCVRYPSYSELQKGLRVKRISKMGALLGINRYRQMLIAKQAVDIHDAKMTCYRNLGFLPRTQLIIFAQEAVGLIFSCVHLALVEKRSLHDVVYALQVGWKIFLFTCPAGTAAQVGSTTCRYWIY